MRSSDVHVGFKAQFLVVEDVSTKDLLAPVFLFCQPVQILLFIYFGRVGHEGTQFLSHHVLVCGFLVLAGYKALFPYFLILFQLVVLGSYSLLLLQFAVVGA